MYKLLNLRVIQIKRELEEVGLGMLLIFGLLCFFIYASYQTYQKTAEAFYLTGVLVGVCLFIQLNRKDKAFVYTNIERPIRAIYMEYVVVTFPFSILSLFTKSWYCYPLLLLLLLFIPLIKYRAKQKTNFKWISSIIKPLNFEWISGFRKSFISLSFFYIAAFSFCWVRIVPLLLLWLMTVVITSFYAECEPLHILKEGNASIKNFLKQKMWSHGTFLLCLYLPILLINTLLNVEYMTINLLFLFSQLVLLCFAISLKYADYRPTRNPSTTNIILAVVSLVALMPYLVPIPLLMTIDYFAKAKRNLKNYLND